MLSDKTTIGTDEKAPAAPKDADDKVTGEKKAVKVVSLSIDENDDFGGDPYNHTGSFCVPDFDD